MKINFRARLHNKTFILSFAAAIITFIYLVLQLFGITPTVDKTDIIGVIEIALTVLTMIGIITDPTTDGVQDSDRAMTYYTSKDERGIKNER